jgi:Bacterial Ig-like domain (group 3)
MPPIAGVPAAPDRRQRPGHRSRWVIGRPPRPPSLSVTTITYGDEQVENLTATVSPEFTGTPTGTVRIKASTKRLCVITLSGAEGSCTLSATQLEAGTYDVVAYYSGSLKFKSSKSSTETLTATS